ncbi:MAG TPA: metallophosphoesterase [Longimicrobiales bacterium]|nr:metallophosphoesterase [Longimicrobiales bacterium]
MIVAHLSDLHLGYGAYDRTERGRNVRERDVAEAFHRAVEQLVRIRPDLVLVAGDVFDRPDPSPAALVALTRGLETLGSELPDTSVVMVAGARDTPRRPGDSGALAALDSFPRVEAATATARSISLRDRSIQVCMIPYRATLREPFPVPEPDARARWNVLVAYAGVADARSRRGVRVESGAWDYVALGSEHTAREVAPGVRYPGSLERVGPTPWVEAGAEKGFLTRDLEARRSEFHAIPGRPVVALAPIRIGDGGGSALALRLGAVIDEVPGGIEGKIVHVTLRGVTASELLEIQGELLASLRTRALHLSLEIEDTPPPRARGSLEERLERALGGADETSPALAALLERALPPARPPEEGTA